MDLCTLREELHQRDEEIERLQKRLSVLDVCVMNEVEL